MRVTTSLDVRAISLRDGLMAVVGALRLPDTEVFPDSLPLWFGDQRLGCVAPAFAGYLSAHRGLVEHRAGALFIDPQLSSEELSAQWHALALACRADGWLPAWRDEAYEVLHPLSGRVICELEWGAFRRFGLRSAAAHVNGIADDGRMWVARRAASRAIDPGMLDNMVGGIAAGERVPQALRRECLEEAGVAKHISAEARSVGSLVSVRREPDGIHHETLYIFDLHLPAGFSPKNRDGEVAAFSLLEREALTHELLAGAFTIDAGAVAADYLLRTPAD